jgi:phosphonate transport system substrate-binding protein
MLNRSKILTLVGLVAVFALLVACAPAAQPTAEPTEVVTEEPTEAPTEAPTEVMTEEPTEVATEEGTDLGTEDNPVIFSFVPSSDAGAVLASAEAITDTLSEWTGLVIEAEVPTSFVASIEAMCAGEAHVGALNTFSYIVAKDRECADVALVSVRSGSPTYVGQIITTADSGITSVADLGGKTFCRPDEFSTSGWIIPSILLRAEGLDPDTDLTEIKDAGGHDGVVRAVYNGECDAGSTFGDARDLLLEEFPDVKEKVVVIATTDPIPNDTVAFGTDVPEEIRTAITDALIAMTEDETTLAMLGDLYRWTGLEVVDDSFYDPFRQLLESAGVSVDDFID